MHACVLVVALLVLGLAPLDIHHPIAEVSAGTPRLDSQVVAQTSVEVDGSLPLRADHVAAAPLAFSGPAGRELVVRFTWPAHGVLTQAFSAVHPGIDIANDVGTPEYAAAAGKVIWAGWGDYGIFVQIDHGNGFQTVYGHMSQVLVTDGQMVSQGQLIGLMGATGRATGPHVHFEIRYNGVPQDPLQLLP
jgi:murein DD-endopeptidase MepM/ murein hydrolase activator NlpD